MPPCKFPEHPTLCWQPKCSAIAITSSSSSDWGRQIRQFGPLVTSRAASLHSMKQGLFCGRRNGRSNFTKPRWEIREESTLFRGNTQIRQLRLRWRHRDRAGEGEERLELGWFIKLVPRMRSFLYIFLLNQIQLFACLFSG